MTLEEALELLSHTPQRPTVEYYLSREWLKPMETQAVPQFDDMDVERIRLIYHLQQEFQVGDDAMDIMLHLLDQLYAMREQMQLVAHAISRQPEAPREQIISLLNELIKPYANYR